MKRQFENGGFGGPAFKKQHTEMPPSRALFVAGFGSAYVTEDMLREIFSAYGPVQTVFMKPDKGIAFVNMGDVGSATAAKNHAETYGIMCGPQRLVVKFGKDSSGGGGGGGGGRQQQQYNRPQGVNTMPHNHGRQQQGWGQQHSPYGAQVGSPGPGGLPPGWQKAMDPNSGREYYYNSQLNITQWEPPVPAPAPGQVPGRNISPIPPQNYPPYGGHARGPMPRGYPGMGQQQGTRACFLGSLPDDVTFNQIAQLANPYGAIDSIKLHADRNNAFVNFVDVHGAQNMYNASQMNPPRLGSSIVRVGWAKSAPIRADVAMAAANGATRTLHLNLKEVPDDVTEEEIRPLVAPFCNDTFDSIQVNNEKRFAFVNLVDLLAAIKTHSHFQSNPMTIHNCPVKVGFGNDRNVRPQKKPNPDLTTTTGESRAVFIGSLPPDTSYAQVCQLGIPYGIIDAANVNSEKGSAFINFVENDAAARIYEAHQANPLKIGEAELKIGWAKSNPLKDDVRNAVDMGANRMLSIKGLTREVTEQALKDALLPIQNIYGVLGRVVLVEMSDDELAAAQEAQKSENVETLVPVDDNADENGNQAEDAENKDEENSIGPMKALIDLGTLTSAMKIKRKIEERDHPIVLDGTKIQPDFATPAEMEQAAAVPQ